MKEYFVDANEMPKLLERIDNILRNEDLFYKNFYKHDLNTLRRLKTTASQRRLLISEVDKIEILEEYIRGKERNKQIKKLGL